MEEPVKVGIIGCGKISDTYLKTSKIFPNIEIVACADIAPEVANKKAEDYGIEALSVDDLLKESAIEIVLNLTIPKAHAEVNLQALHAGKHVHCEKPFALSRKEGMPVITLAQEKGLMVGCAPDTFLGGGHQTCRKMIDDGCIGKAVSGTAFMLSHGPEHWHPNVGFYYEKGGGPLFDMGPYYITALVNLLGPVNRVCSFSGKAFEERIATSKELMGKVIPVETPTHVAGTLEFSSGALVTIIMSFDIWYHSTPPIEIHGEKRSLKVPDPNGFKGPVFINKEGGREWETVPLSHGYIDPMRVIGVADMAKAIRGNRKNRCSGELAYHVLDVMESLLESAEKGKFIELESTTERPDPLPLGLEEGELD